MEKKIAILRGINVGGNRKILMNDLKSMFHDLGIPDAITYIQSGNVIFESSLDPIELSDLIESAILEKFGFVVPVIIRKAKELEKSIKSNPFYDSEADVNNLHLTFLKQKPLKSDLDLIQSIDYTPDLFVVKDMNVFIYCEGKYHESKLTNNFFEKKLKVGATTRNWKTVLKLMELSEG
ncbi:DUF1697 domain-containing protein [Brumimicrobium glaciale]|uniref:DUF1697 domain-containing protein n=1 Tax=Brumimicrobium glaciale TaxID=200475 RepID=A0A4Q4KNF9_9FLAO|nr:DUF1697 domain-containing protein [Brumimicrobium glaciale]RYM34902.1 DUF1697 domain-containing protein [Brumimicrobium glaciale]